MSIAYHISEYSSTLAELFGDICAKFILRPANLQPRCMQMTLISLRILVGYAKSTHRNLAQLCRAPYQPRPPSTIASSAPNVGPNNERGHANGEPNSPSPSTSAAAAAAAVSGEPSLFQIDQDDDEDDGRGALPWDPLAPRLLEEAQRLAKEGRDRPFTAAVVLAAALPFSGAAVVFGAPMLVGDAALQWGAGTPIGRTVGHGTRNAVEVRG